MAIDRAALAVGGIRLASGVSFLVDPLRANRLWGDPDESAVLRSLRGYLGDSGGRRNYQAPVSYRIVPRILGHAHRAVAAAEHAA